MFACTASCLQYPHNKLGSPLLFESILLFVSVLTFKFHYNSIVYKHHYILLGNISNFTRFYGLLCGCNLIKFRNLKEVHFVQCSNDKDAGFDKLPKLFINTKPLRFVLRH